MTDCNKFNDYVPNYLEIDKMKVNTIDIETLNEEQNIQADTATYVFDSQRKSIKTIDGSIEASIVVNNEDKQYINEECSENSKLLDEERENKREMYFRHSRVLYPEVQPHILSLAVDAYMEQQDKGIDITTHKFDKDADKY